MDLPLSQALITGPQDRVENLLHGASETKSTRQDLFRTEVNIKSSFENLESNLKSF